jgi:hypothetical protein
MEGERGFAELECGGVTQFRVVTWNVENLFPVGADAGPATEAEFAKIESLKSVIDAQNPDVVALQEVGGEQVLARLQERLMSPLPHRAIAIADGARSAASQGDRGHPRRASGHDPPEVKAAHLPGGFAPADEDQRAHSRPTHSIAEPRKRPRCAATWTRSSTEAAGRSQ